MGICLSNQSTAAAAEEKEENEEKKNEEEGGDRDADEDNMEDDAADETKVSIICLSWLLLTNLFYRRMRVECLQQDILGD